MRAPDTSSALTALIRFESQTGVYVNGLAVVVFTAVKHTANASALVNGPGFEAFRGELEKTSVWAREREGGDGGGGRDCLVASMLGCCSTILYKKNR